MQRQSDDRHKPGFGVQPQLMTCHKPGFGSEPGLMTVVAPSSHRRVLVVMPSSCRRHAVVMPSVYSRRAVSTSSSCCRAIAVRPSAHCRRAVVSIVIWTRRDFSYPTRACLLNYAKLYIYIGVSLGVKALPRNKMKIVVSALAKQPAEPPAN